MKSITSFIVPLCLSLLLVSGTASAMTIGVDPAAPSADGDDISNFGTFTTDQLVWTDRPQAGQSFITGSNAAGYSLNSITVQIFNESGGSPVAVQGWKDWQFRFGTLDAVSDGSGKEWEMGIMYNSVTRYEPDEAFDQFWTFTFDTPISLAASTEYAFDIGIDNSQESWSAGIPRFRTTAGTGYGDGTLITSSAIANNGEDTNQLDDITGLDSTGESYLNKTSNTDLIFEADLTAVPEPSTLGFLVAAIGTLCFLRRRS